MAVAAALKKTWSEPQAKEPDRVEPAGPSEDVNYYLNVLSRGAYEPSRFPQALNGHEGKASLDNLDSCFGNLWRFKRVGAAEFSATAALQRQGSGTTQRSAKPALKKVGSEQFQQATLELALGAPGDAPRNYVLSCQDVEGKGYLTTGLTLVAEERRAQVFQATPYARPSSKQRLPGEFAIQLKAAGSNKILCADLRKGLLLLLSPGEVDTKDPSSGLFVYSDAWEAIPDEELPEAAVAMLYGRGGAEQSISRQILFSEQD